MTNLKIISSGSILDRIEYSKDDGKTWMDGGKDTAYIYNGLKKNTTYTLKSRVIENGDEITESNSITVTTSDITTPVYEIDKTGWTTSKVVTITYPTVENQDLTYQYSLDKGASWKSATESQKVTFNANGTIIARVTDGTNTVTGSTFVVDKIDRTPPTMSVAGNTTDWTINKTLTVTASDSESGLHATAYSFDDGKTWQISNSKTITTNGTYVVKVRDAVGNIASQSIVVSKVSTTAPTITITKGNVGSNYITVNATIVDNEMGISKIEYSKDNGQSWVNAGTNQTYIFSGLTKNTSYTIKAKVTSKNGKSTISNALTISTSDITTPTYAVSPSGWAKSKTVTITYPTIANQTLTYEYSIDKGSSWKTATQSQNVTFNANGTIIARVKDGTNTVTATTFTVNQIDTTVPTMSVSGNTTDWTINKTLTITANDSESGLHATAYSFDDGKTWQTSNSKTITTNGTYVVKVRDAVGNIASQNIVVSKVSTTAPTITIAKGNVGSNYITVNATVVDNEMGISKIEYSKDNGTTWVNAGTNTTYVFSGLTKNTSYIIKAKVTSKNGKSTISNALTISTSDITTPTYAVSPSGWAKSKTVTITYPTITNQTLTYEYSLDKGSSWKTATQSQKVTFNSNGTIIARVKDGTNTVTATTFTVNQIDNEGPEIAVSASTYDWVPGSITLTVTGKDTGSGISGSAYSINGGSYSTTNTYTTSAAGNISIKVKDVLGNESSVNVKVESRTEYGYQPATYTKTNVYQDGNSASYAPYFKNVYKYKYNYKQNYSYTDFTIANIGAGAGNVWSKAVSGWHITNIVTDIDVANSTYWNNYYQPKVDFKCGSTVIYTMPASSNVSTNGKWSGHYLCNGTIYIYSYGATGSGRNWTGSGGSNKITYYTETVKTSNWVFSSSEITDATSIGSVVSSGYVLPTWKTATGWRTGTAYTATADAKPTTRTTIHYAG